MLTAALAFAAVAAVLTLTPGVDTALVLRNTFAGGRRTGTVTATGICSGLLLWGAAASVGVTALLTASTTAYDGLRLVGAAYLVVLGIRTLTRHRGQNPHEPAARDRPRPSSGSAFRAGLVTNLLNPKIGVFYVTLLPQFVPAGAPVLPTTLLFAAIHAAEGLVWLSSLALLAARAGGVLGRPGVRRRLERTTGVVLVGLGVGLALDRQ